MHVRDLKLFKGRKGDVLSALTLNDAGFWGADLFVGTIFALYVTLHIPGGSATHVGILFAVYRLTRAFLSLPIGRFFDRHKGLIDEMWALALSGLGVGMVYILLFFATDLWHVYVAMIFIGIGHALNIGGWNVIFYASMSKAHSGEIVGVYQTVMQIVYALSAAIAGFAGDAFGFEFIMLVAGIVTVVSGIVPLTIRKSLR